MTLERRDALIHPGLPGPRVGQVADRTAVHLARPDLRAREPGCRLPGPLSTGRITHRGPLSSGLPADGDHRHAGGLPVRAAADGHRRQHRRRARHAGPCVRLWPTYRSTWCQCVSPGVGRLSPRMRDTRRRGRWLLALSDQRASRRTAPAPLGDSRDAAAVGPRLSQL
jgi:hypothetical protein